MSKKEIKLKTLDYFRYIKICCQYKKQIVHTYLKNKSSTFHHNQF